MRTRLTPSTWAYQPSTEQRRLKASFLSILGTVEEHHGAYSHDPPLSVLQVVGIEPSAAAIEELAAYGFGRIEPSDDGFIARRDRT
jgi:hypothetical protein